MKKIIAANWKMNKLRKEAQDTAEAMAQSLKSSFPAGRICVVFPPFTDIAVVAEKFKGIDNLFTGGQNFYPEPKGAFTGEISLDMLRESGADWALVGHSERRHILHESDGLIARKTAYALEQGFNTMLCIGETLKEREDGHLKEVLKRQLDTAVSPVAKRTDLTELFSIAYEPVWAIGTGKVAGEKEILEAHALTRTLLKDIIGDRAKDTPILYGGSVKPKNAGAILKLENVDGVLVGGASLEAESFLDIIRA